MELDLVQQLRKSEGIVSAHGPVTLTCSTRWPSANPHCYSKKARPWHNADQGEWRLRGFYSGADWPPTSVPYQLPAGLAGLAGPPPSVAVVGSISSVEVGHERNATTQRLKQRICSSSASGGCESSPNNSRLWQCCGKSSWIESWNWWRWFVVLQRMFVNRDVKLMVLICSVAASVCE